MKDKSEISITLVEDDELLRENYSEILSEDGYVVTAFGDRFNAIDHINRSSPDLVILDIGLATEKYGGITLCHQIRERYTKIPIIYLTSHDSETEKIQGLQCEVDDYLTKDISTDYLLVRIETLLKRFYQLSNTDTDTSQLVRGDLRLVTGSYEAYWKEHKVKLSFKQYLMLQELALFPGHVKTPSKLMSVANIVVEPNTVAANVKAIRKAFRAIDPDFNMIKSEYGIGYRWVAS